MQEYLDKKSNRYECEFRVKVKDGSLKWIHAIGKGIWDMEGKLVRMSGSHTDITDIKAYEYKLRHLAYHDPLTGLPNRMMFNEKMPLMLSMK